MELSDLSKLPSITEESIIAYLKSRLLSNVIYTWAGTNLIAVNPFQDVGTFEHPELNQLIQQLDGIGSPLPAHVHSIAQMAYHGLATGIDQAVIISGESGAGKTFSAHRLLHYLVQLEERGDRGAGHAMEQKLNVSSPLLEAFGNARTTSNGNSSRFCKLFRLSYSDGSLRGGSVHTCLFEKTRVTWQSGGERSFHIFYQLLAGLPAASLRTLGLERWPALAALAGRPGAGDATAFAVTEAAMAELGLSGAQRAAVFAVLAALLHLGRLVVVPEGDRFRVEQDAPLLAASRLMGVLARRDCLARELYDGLFRWLVDWVNVQIAPADAAPRTLSLLDISGFESLECNSLEQLCINYANERLQQFFLASFLRRLEAAFLEEGLLGARLEYADNEPLLAALDGPAPSVFGAVDECGPVAYDARRLIDKNRDRVDPCLTALLAGSSAPLSARRRVRAAATRCWRGYSGP
ncbi:unconventional myosin-XIX-like [Pollicipes pollicipes]|uniref:unconventional myosin-XIX-like n=1 Tax=Pollicipes pollicipes TaxID=41117 RepID=UPI0018851CE2|nr:unconventional myosin-XIX-like [Pollicipes pollicipes]